MDRLAPRILQIPSFAHPRSPGTARERVGAGTPRRPGTAAPPPGSSFRALLAGAVAGGYGEPGAFSPPPPAGAPRRAQLAWAAQQLETLFLQDLLRRLRETQLESGLFGDGFGAAYFRELHDRALAREMAEAGGIGLASLILQQMDPGEENGTKPQN